MVLPQFHFNGNIANNLTLELPQAMEEDEGDYICVILPENSDADTCSFNLSKWCNVEDCKSVMLWVLNCINIIICWQKCTKLSEQRNPK